MTIEAMHPRHTISPDLDRRLVSYAAMSWNAYEAVYTLQQMVSLLPGYGRDLESMYGKAGLGDARRAWGVVADLVSAMAAVPPTMETLIDFGFTQAVEVGHIIPFGGQYSLSMSPILRRLDFRAAILGDLGPVLRAAVEHDAVAKPLLDAFQEEIRAYDAESTAGIHGDSEIRSLRDLVRTLPDVPTEFPSWDGRPMFLDEQRVLLDYLAKNAGTEIVADALVDEPLGEFLLRASGIIRSSDFNGEPIFDLNLVSHDLLKRPVELVCHQAGNAVLNALKLFSQQAELLDQLFIVETAVFAELGLDVTPALASTRQLAVEHHMRGFVETVVDLRNETREPTVADATPFEFPDLSAD